MRVYIYLKMLKNQSVRITVNTVSKSEIFRTPLFLVVSEVDLADSVAGFLSGHLTGNDPTIPKPFFFQSHLFLFGYVPVKCPEKTGQLIF